MQKILILAAIPHGLRLDQEIREIEEAIRRAKNRDLFEICIRTAVRPQDIRRAIAEEKPQIVHFCGHGEEDGSLRLEDDGGNKKPLAPEDLAFLFELHADYVKCVLLNACYSEKPAVAISQYIDYVIGMNNSIQDKPAIAFAQGFYDGLGYKNSGNQDMFQRAFDEAMVAIKMETYSQGEIPVLKKLLSQKVEYIKLKNLLKNHKWKEADQETAKLMLQPGNNSLSPDVIRQLPCEVLTEINQLWVQFSKGRFGFSIQSATYQSLKDSNKSDNDIWREFFERVGWENDGEPVPYSDLNFDINAPEGHLPIWALTPNYSAGRSKIYFRPLVERFIECSKQD